MTDIEQLKTLFFEKLQDNVHSHVWSDVNENSDVSWATNIDELKHAVRAWIEWREEQNKDVQDTLNEVLKK